MRSVAYVVADVGSEGRLLEDPDLAFTVGNLLADLLDVRQESDFTLLATASTSKHRLSILARLLDSSVEVAQQQLRRAHERLEMQETEEVYPRPTPYIPPPDQTIIDPQTNAEPELVQQAENPPIPLKLPDDVRAEPSTPPSSRTPRKISLRVQDTPEVIHRNGQSASHITPRLYQDVAFKFEEAERQERLPLYVAHLQGQEAYGCDILSFRTEEDRIAFRTETEHPDIALVERFIEVKGSSSQGEVTLTTNEKDAASRYKDRYYIYRVTPSKEAGSFALAILNDPLDSSYKLVYQITHEQSARSEYWTIVGG